MFLTNYMEYPFCPNFSPKLFRVWKNLMFLMNQMENRQTFKFQPEIISRLGEPHVFDEPHGISPNFRISAQNQFEFVKTTCFWWTTWNIATCPNFSSKLFRVWKNHMFLMNHMKNRHTSKVQSKISFSSEKPHVSNEPHGKSRFFQNLAQNQFEFGKTTCFWWITWNIAICQNFSPKSVRVWKNHMFLMNHMEYRHLSKFQPNIIPSL